MQITRLAPSPTGALHLGNARTFLVNWLLARQKGWRIILRIEDLDGPRIKRGADQQAIEDLRWLGIDWDEGPICQSSRMGRYRAAIESLLSRGLAYPCICTRKEAALAASAPHAEDGASVYPGTCRGRFASLDEARAAAGGREPAIRFVVSSKPIEFDDGFRGRVCFENPAAQLGDFVIAKADATPAYQLAVVVDDAEMQITQIVRGDDLLDSTPRQILLYHALNLSDKIPYYTHLPLVVGPDGRRLAKRHGDTRLSHYRELGVPAENVISLLARWCGMDQGQGASGKGPEEGNPAFRSRQSASDSSVAPGLSPLAPLLPCFDLKRIPPSPIIMSPSDEPRA
jgi:glutamyl-tRNA synthetase